jgi:hypothetical protein
MTPPPPGPTGSGDQRLRPPRLVEVRTAAGWQNAQLEVMRETAGGRFALVLLPAEPHRLRRHEWLPMSVVRRRQTFVLGAPGGTDQ